MLIFAAFYLCLTIFFPSPVNADDAQKVHSSSSLGIEFRYPSRFLIGKYKKEELIERMKGLDIDSSFNNAIVLIEPKQLREFPLMEIPVGEVPTISFNLLRGTRASFAKRQFFKEVYKVSIGNRTVYRLPGYPGPYGDQAFYYLVPAEMHDVLEIIAHRYYFRDDPIGRIDKLPKTNYDTVIENIVRSMEFH
jgi:hypothetical protein